MFLKESERLLGLRKKQENFFHGAKPRNGSGPNHCHDPSHIDTPQSVGLLWTSDQPDAEIST
jgi:hypothetical protein